MSLELKFLNLGEVSYEEAYLKQKEYAQRRLRGGEDVVLVATHPPTITLGSNSKWNILHASEEELEEKGILLHRTSRGGGATYLGPGQVVFYPALNLSEMKLGVWDYLRKVEESANSTALEFGLKTEIGEEYNSAVGKMYKCVWYVQNGKKHKFLAQGVRLTKGVIVEGGFSMYLDSRAHQHFGLIDHCGFKLDEVGATSFEEMAGRKIEHSEILDVFYKKLNENITYPVPQVAVA